MSRRTPQRIMLTGTASNVGRALAVQLLEAGHEVFGIDRSGEGVPAFDFRVCTEHPDRPVELRNGLSLNVQHGLEALEGADLVAVAATTLRSFPPAVVAAAAKILRQAQHTPTPLSELVDAAAATDSEVVGAAVDDVIELVTLAGLWAYAPDTPEPGDTNDTGIDALISTLTAHRTDRTIDRPAVWGDELMISSTEAPQ